MPTSIRKSPENKLPDIDHIQEKNAQKKHDFTIKNGAKTNIMLLEIIINVFSERWRIWILRGIFSFLLISYFCITVYVGPVLIMATILFIQVKSFTEIINIGYNVYPVNEQSLFKFLSWYLLVAANYFCYEETLVDYFSPFMHQIVSSRRSTSYHRFFSFCMYFVGIMWFVVSLRKKYDMHQFSLLACTHVAILFIVVQSYMYVKNIFEGLIWLAVPVTSVVCNDIMAYIFGKVFGKTPLIRVSPTKTWEGFIGAAISTIIYGCILSYILCQYPYFVCPTEYTPDIGTIKINKECEISDIFKLKNYTFAINFPMIFLGEFNFKMYPFIFHAFIITLFGSIVAPFGGFFASGFKRACNVKDFGDVIPGHGGILDRFDCQFLVGTFVNVYITSFIKTNCSPESIFAEVMYIQPHQQVEFFHMLNNSLQNSFK